VFLVHFPNSAQTLGQLARDVDHCQLCDLPIQSYQSCVASVSHKQEIIFPENLATSLLAPYPCSTLSIVIKSRLFFDILFVYQQEVTLLITSARSEKALQSKNFFEWTDKFLWNFTLVV